MPAPASACRCLSLRWWRTCRTLRPTASAISRLARGPVRPGVHLTGDGGSKRALGFGAAGLQCVLRPHCACDGCDAGRLPGAAESLHGHGLHSCLHSRLKARPHWAWPPSASTHPSPPTPTPNHPTHSHPAGERIQREFGLPNLVRFPIVPDLSAAGDSGRPVVVTDPTGPTAQAFLELGAAVVREVGGVGGG